MRCMACGAEMRLVQVEPDATMAVPGYAHHTFECPACKETERRLTFNAHAPSPVRRSAAGERRRFRIIGCGSGPGERRPIGIAGAPRRRASALRPRAAGLVPSRRSAASGPRWASARRTPPSRCELPKRRRQRHGRKDPTRAWPRGAPGRAPSQSCVGGWTGALKTRCECASRPPMGLSGLRTLAICRSSCAALARPPPTAGAATTSVAYADRRRPDVVGDCPWPG